MTGSREGIHKATETQAHVGRSALKLTLTIKKVDPVAHHYKAVSQRQAKLQRVVPPPAQRIEENTREDDKCRGEEGQGSVCSILDDSSFLRGRPSSRDQGRASEKGEVPIQLQQTKSQR